MSVSVYTTSTTPSEQLQGVCLLSIPYSHCPPDTHTQVDAKEADINNSKKVPLLLHIHMPMLMTRKFIMKYWTEKIKKHAAWIKKATEETRKSCLENNNSKIAFHNYYSFL